MKMMSHGYTIPCPDKANPEKQDEKGKLKISIRINRLDKLEVVIKKRVIPLMEEYPYAEINIEVEC